MADEKKYVEEPIERTPAQAKGTSTFIEEPLERAPAAAKEPVNKIPENYGFTGSNLLSAAKEGLVGFGRGVVGAAHDVLTNPDWLIGQGKTLREKLGDPNTSFNRIIGTPAMEEHRKAAGLYSALKDQSRTTGRAPIEKIAEMGGHELASLVPIAGPWAAHLGERAGTGDIGGAVAEGGTQVLAGAALPKIAGKIGEEAAAVPKVWRGLKKLGTGETPEVAPIKPVETPAKVMKVPAQEPPVSLGTRPPRAVKTSYFNPEGIEPPAKELPKLEGEPESEHLIRTRTEAPTKHVETIAEELRDTAAKEAEAKRAAWEAGPKKLPTLKVEDGVNQAVGVKPLKPDVPLREQLTSQPAAPGEVVDPVKEKYPDPAVRQMVRANGEAIYEAAKGNPETLKAIHDLTRVELRQALINAGEDMGQVTVSNSKFAGEGSIPREEAFSRLLKRRLDPEEIVKLATGKMENEASFMPEEPPKTSNLPAQRAARERAARIKKARQ